MSYDELPSPSQIESNLWICDFYNLYDPKFLPESGINAVVSLLDDYAPLFDRPEFSKYITKDRHLFIKCSDTKTQDLLSKFEQICVFVQQMTADGGVVLVHCEEGVSRSPTAVIAYIMRRDKKGLTDVLAQVRQERKIADPSDNFISQLKVWEQTCADKN